MYTYTASVSYCNLICITLPMLHIHCHNMLIVLTVVTLIKLSLLMLLYIATALVTCHHEHHLYTVNITNNGLSEVKARSTCWRKSPHPLALALLTGWGLSSLDDVYVYIAVLKAKEDKANNEQSTTSGDPTFGEAADPHIQAAIWRRMPFINLRGALRLIITW